MRHETGSPKILYSGNELFQSSVSWRWPKTRGLWERDWTCQTWLWECAEWREVRESRTSGVATGQRSRSPSSTKGSWPLGTRLGDEMNKKLSCPYTAIVLTSVSVLSLVCDLYLPSTSSKPPLHQLREWPCSVPYRKIRILRAFYRIKETGVHMFIV